MLPVKMALAHLLALSNDQGLDGDMSMVLDKMSKGCAEFHVRQTVTNIPFSLQMALEKPSFAGSGTLCQLTIDSTISRREKEGWIAQLQRSHPSGATSIVMIPDGEILAMGSRLILAPTQAGKGNAEAY